MVGTLRLGLVGVLVQYRFQLYIADASTLQLHRTMPQILNHYR